MRTTTRTRSLLVAACVGAVIAVCVGPASAQTACGDAVEGSVGLCGVTTVTAGRTSAVALTLPTAVTLRPSSKGTYIGADGGADIVGQGKLPGFVLARVDDGGQTGLFAAWVQPSKLRLEVVRSFGEVQGNIAAGFTLPAGRYMLYVLADSGDVTVTLSPDGYDGTVRLRAGLAVDHVLKDLPRAFADPASSALAAGAEADLDGDGLAFRAVYVIGEPYLGSVLGTCIYEGAPQQGYLPGCPAAPLLEAPIVSGQFPHAGLSVSPSGAAMTSVTTGLKAGSYGQGVWYANGGKTVDFGAVGLWLTLD